MMRQRHVTFLKVDISRLLYVRFRRIALTFWVVAVERRSHFWSKINLKKTCKAQNYVHKPLKPASFKPRHGAGLHLPSHICIF